MRERPRFSGLAFTASAGKTDSEASAVSEGVSKANVVLPTHQPYVFAPQ